MKIDVWYDVVCPWCWLGKARLDAALAGRSDVEVISHSFELDTKQPKDVDVSTTEMLEKKYGMSRAQIDALHGKMTAMGREVGIEFQFDRVRTANTFDAHQLVHHARAAAGNDAANRMVDLLFGANFRDGRRVGTRDVLLALAKEAGLDEAAAGVALDEQRHAKDVRDDESAAQQIGIGGVPFFVFAEKLAVSGAQSIEVLSGALARAATL